LNASRGESLGEFRDAFNTRFSENSRMGAERSTRRLTTA
jgi:hypothetical protein